MTFSIYHTLSSHSCDAAAPDQREATMTTALFGAAKQGSCHCGLSIVQRDDPLATKDRSNLRGYNARSSVRVLGARDLPPRPGLPEPRGHESRAPRLGLPDGSALCPLFVPP